MVHQRRFLIIMVYVGMMIFFGVGTATQGAYRFEDFRARPPIHIYGSVSAAPKGMAPAQIKSAYHLPAKGGTGTIAIIIAYDHPDNERDLGVFSREFGLRECTTANRCFEKHKMDAQMKKDSGWTLEAAMDTQWAHAIAPDAKILLVEAKTPSGPHLMAAVDYARSRPDVIAVSMSWGGGEFPEEIKMDAHFKSDFGAVFFASSGDNGTGANWPAASPHVVAVGGTSLSFSKNGAFASEKAWEGSGGGVSAYEPQPAYQKDYDIARASGKRAIPDVSYDADPASGFSVYRSTGKNSKLGWYVLGGTSAGAPQWAGIQALGHSAGNENFYRDKAGGGHANYFRDIASGANGSCQYYCEARRRYDFVTGLGSPLTISF